MPTFYAVKPKTPCPWCGVVPALCKMRDELSANGVAHWVECQNRECPMHEVSTRNHDKSTEAVEAWEKMMVTVVAAAFVVPEQ